MKAHGRSMRRSLGVVTAAGLWFVAAWLHGVPGALAATARTWYTTVDYFNPDNQAANLSVGYRTAGGSGPDTAPLPVAAWASGSVQAGATVPAGFSGAAVVTSDRPVAVLYRQRATGAAPTAPMLYSSFTRADAGTGKFFVPEVRRGPAGSTVLGIQNLADGDIALSLDFVSATGALKKTLNLPAVKPASSAVFNLATTSVLGTTFDGSVQIRARKVAGGAAAPVLASAEVIPATGREGYAFSGLNGASTQVVTPAMCLAAGTKTLSSLLQVQNAGTGSARFTVSYFYPVASGSATAVKKAAVATAFIPPGRRVTVDPCAVAAVKGRSGVVAVIAGRNTAGSPSPVAAVSRWVMTGSGTQYAAAAARPPVARDTKYRSVFPAVEWSSSGTRTRITVMNAAPQALSAAKPFPVRISFYSQAGVLVRSGVMSIVTAGSFDASSAGALVSGSFKGAVVVESSQPFVATAQVQQSGFAVADGYAGIPW